MTPTLRRVEIVDTTLRDGAQSPGVAFDADQRLAIARALADAGVDEVEAGCPAMGDGERAVIARTVALGLPTRLTGWCRADAADLDAAAACGLSAVHVAIPASCLQLTAMDKSWGWAVKTLETLLPVARDRFGFLSVGVMDASRTKPARLVAIARRCAELGVDRLRLADTVGVWNPRTAAAAVDAVRRTVRETGVAMAIGVHTHNDLGMAVGNAVAAVEAGAASADVTVLGLGERAGNAPLEELVMALRMTTDVACGVDHGRLASLCGFVGDAAGCDVSPRKPVVGGNAFRHESGVHVRGVLRDPRCFEPFDPEAVGRRDRRVELGTHSGRAGLVAALRSCGVDPEPAALEPLLRLVRREAERARGPVSTERAATLYRLLIGGGCAAGGAAAAHRCIERTEACVA